MTRYHPLLVALHWILALMVIVGLVMGGRVLAQTANTDPAKLFSLRMHMSLGMVIGVLTLIRLGTRLFTTKPPHADIGNATLNKLGQAAHWGLYALVFGMVASGIGISLMAGLPDIVFGGSDAPLPADFSTFPPRAAHGLLATLLGLTILGHVGAALYHQFVRRDGLLSRMWFDKRSGGGNA